VDGSAWMRRMRRPPSRAAEQAGAGDEHGAHAGGLPAPAAVKHAAAAAAAAAVRLREQQDHHHDGDGHERGGLPPRGNNPPLVVQPLLLRMGKTRRTAEPSAPADASPAASPGCLPIQGVTAAAAAAAVAPFPVPE
jgi:hypothetical protein